MTTDDDMREIGNAIENYLDWVTEARDDDGVSESEYQRGVDRERAGMLALIRSKLEGVLDWKPGHPVLPTREHQYAVWAHKGDGNSPQSLTLYMTDKDGKTTRFVPEQSDAEHERAVEAWRRRASEVPSGDAYVVLQDEIDEALRLMRARPVEDKSVGYEILADTYRSTLTAMIEAKKAAGELRQAIEAAERAGVKP